MSARLGVVDVYARLRGETMTHVLGGAIEVADRAARARDLDEVESRTDGGRLGADRGDALALELRKNAVVELFSFLTPFVVFARGARRCEHGGVRVYFLGAGGDWSRDPRELARAKPR